MCVKFGRDWKGFGFWVFVFLDIIVLGGLLLPDEWLHNVCNVWARLEGFWVLGFGFSDIFVLGGLL